MAPPRGLPPGAVALRISDTDLLGFRRVDCVTASTRFELTAREQDVLFLSLCGKCPKEIAMLLDLKPSYVRRLVQLVVRRLREKDGLTGIRRCIATIRREREHSLVEWQREGEELQSA